MKSREIDLVSYTGISYETGDMRLETRDWRHETGDWRTGAGLSRLTSHVPRPTSHVSSLILIVFLTAILIPCFAVFAQSEETKTLFYDYSANKMNFDRKNGVTILEGEVKLKVRDSEDFLNADKVTIYRDVKTGELIRMEAVGNVDMIQEGMKATCERAIFHETEDRVEMEGAADSPAVVDDGKNRMEAPNITLFRKENRIEASGSVSGHVTIKEQESKEQEDETSEESASKGEE